MITSDKDKALRTLHILLILVLSALAASALADDDYDRVTNLKTRYGLVQLHAHSDEISVNGNLISGGQGAYDSLENLGHFQLKDEDVIVFWAGNTGSVGVPDDLFFLILKPATAPKIVDTPLNPGVNEIKKVWQKGDAVFIDFAVGDYDKFTSPLKFEHDALVMTKAVPEIYQKSGPRLTDDDCQTLYDIARESCAIVSTTYHKACAGNAIAGNVYRSRSDMMFFTGISNLPGYSENDFNRICISWCKGKGTDYKTFGKNVCHIQ